MKRKIVCGIALCLALSAAGCGKSQEQQASNYYQNELGLSEDEANDLAHELYGSDEQEENIVEEGPVVVEPLPELLDSQWYEGKVQVYDMVFSNDMFMTAEDVRRIVEASEYEVELVESFDKDGNVVPDRIELDGKMIASFLTTTRGFSNGSEANDMVAYGMLEEGEFCMVASYWMANDNDYDKATTEFASLQTRDDVLAYLSASGIDEVSEEQAVYRSFSAAYETVSTNINNIYPNESDTTYANVDHYTTHGAQSITLYRVHELGATDQVIEHEGAYNHKTYDGAILNRVNCVVFKFGADGTVSDVEWGMMNFIVMGEEIG